MGDSFGQFLAKKGINSEEFRRDFPVLFLQWQAEFNLLGAPAFDLRKKFFWNDLRLVFKQD